MAKNLEMLRSLKEHYSSEYESSRNETDVWHRKVQELEDSVKTTKQQILAVGRQRDKALERAKEARSQEDEYFEENSRLEQQDEALNAKLAEVGAAANRTQEENKVLDQQVQDLKDEAAREKANSHAAWVQNQDELTQAKEDLKVSMEGNRDLQAQLQHAQSILNDKERHTLGLPPLKKQANAVKAAAPATPATAPAATPPRPPAVVPLTEKFEEGPTKPLTPQLNEVKHWEAVAPVAPKRLLARAPPAPKVLPPPAVATSNSPAVKDNVATPVQNVPAAEHVRALPVQKTVVKPQALLKGEPPKPSDDAAAMLASVTEPTKTPSKTSSRSALQKLADFFASPLQR